VSVELPAPLKVVCRVAGVSRSAAQEQRRRRRASAADQVPARRRPGPVGALPDRELLVEIRRDLDESPFVGEGHRKVWARLRRQGIRTSRKRVLRLTREVGLLAPTPQVRKRAERLHEGTITVDVPDTLWATDATEAWTRQEGRCAVFVIVDHASNEVWYDAAKRMDRFAAADLLREVCAERFGLVEQGSPPGSRSATTAAPASAPTTTRPRSTTSASPARPPSITSRRRTASPRRRSRRSRSRCSGSSASTRSTSSAPPSVPSAAATTSTG